MVKRRLKIILSILSPLVLVFVATVWLFGTSTGARWLIGQLPGVESVEVRGPIAGTLAIEDLKVVMADRTVHLRSMEWQMYPLGLFKGSLHWAEIALHGMDIVISTDDIEPEDGTFFLTNLQLYQDTFPGWLGWLDVNAESLIVEDILIRRSGQEIFRLDDLQASADWSDKWLKLKLEKLRTGFGSAQADFSLDMETFEGAFQFVGQLAQVRYGLEKVETQWRFSPDDNDQVRAIGMLDLVGQSELLGRVDAQLLFSSERLRVENLIASRPGRPGELKIDGNLSWPKGPYTWSGRLGFRNIELDEWNIPLRLDGNLNLAGRPEKYAGRFALTRLNPEWQFGALAGAFSGNRQGVDLTELSGEILQGTLAGTAEVNWQTTFHSVAAVQLRGIDVNHFLPDIDSNLNGNFSGNWLMLGDDSSWKMNLDILPSEWQANNLSGELAAGGNLERVDIETLRIRGDGLDLEAAGLLAEQVDFNLQIARLSSWWPKTDGVLTAAGRLQWKSGYAAAFVQGDLQDVAAYGATLDQIEFSGGMDGWLQNIEFAITGRALNYRQKNIDRIDLGFTGSPAQHRLTMALDWASGELDSSATGGWRDGIWQGDISSLQVSEQEAGVLTLRGPVELEAGRRIFRVSPVQLESDRNERVEVRTDFTMDPITGTARLSWNDLQLARFNPWLPMQMTGVGSGDMRTSVDAGVLVNASVEAIFGLDLKWQELELVDSKIQVSGDWNRDGLRLNQTTIFSEGGELHLNVSSFATPDWNLPEQGKFQFDWIDLPLIHAGTWLPPKMAMAGSWEGEAFGTWKNGGEVMLDWSSQIEEGQVGWRDQVGTMTASNLTGYLDGKWQNNKLSVDSGLDLSRQGRLESDLLLPLSSRFPFPFKGDSSWGGYLALDARESGLLSYFLPGMVEQTDGKLTMAVDLAGTPAKPSLNGRFALTEASASIPALGIRLDQIEFHSTLVDDEINVGKLSLASGDGNLFGEGRFRFSGWKLTEQKWSVKGVAMPLVRLPELELFATPDLQGEGAAGKLEIRGGILVPRMRLSSINAPGQMPVSPSPDVVVVKKSETTERVLPLRLDARIRIELGDEVVVDTAGVDARLGGEVTLNIEKLNQVFASGQIMVEQGTYSSYGLRLPIHRGQLLFAGGPIQRPTLNILAYKTIGEVKAGVKVTGTPRQPLVKLYSEPAMPDTDILSYIILGRPLDEEGGQTDAFMLAATALLSRGESVAFQDALQRRLGIDVIQVNTGEGDINESVVTIGKYLEPGLYVSLGYSVFNQTNELRLRYNLSEHWELQSNIGEESGADIYYRFDFN